MEKCEQFSNNKSPTSQQDIVYKKQIEWLKRRFQTSNCSEITSKITNLKSYNEIIPSGFYNLISDKEEYALFKPYQFKNTRLQFLVNDENEWFELRFLFQKLDLFRDFTNLKHINHSFLETGDLCETLKNQKAITSITVQANASSESYLTIQDKDIQCLKENGIHIFIAGNFDPSKATEALNSQIYGIEDFNGDMSTIVKYQNLKYLGLLTKTIGSGLKELVGLRKITHLHLNLLNIDDPEEIRNLGQLQYLTMNCFLYNTSVKSNGCEEKYLKDIDFLKSFNSLIGLDLSWNKIRNISPIKNLTNLTFLSLNTNIIENIESLIHLKRLKYLDISNNKISHLEGIERLRDLEFLDASLNRIERIHNVSKLNKLKYLSAAGNPYTLNHFNPSKSLKVLNLGGSISSSNFWDKETLMQTLTEEYNFDWVNTILFGQFKDVLNDGSLTILPNDSILRYDTKRLKDVEYLSLRENNLGREFDLSKMKLLKYLDLSYNAYKHVFSLHGISQSIVLLKMEGNSLSQLSDMDHLSSLKLLDLTGNNFINGYEAASMPSLKTLILDRSNLKGSLNLNASPNIKTLSLEDNKIQHINFETFKNLESIYLKNNLLKEIPSFEGLRLLRAIDLSNNLIQNIELLRTIHSPLTLSEYIQQVTVYINLQGNQIKDFSLFSESKFDFLDINLADQDASPTMCPKNSSNHSVSEYCNSL